MFAVVLVAEELLRRPDVAGGAILPRPADGIRKPPTPAP
jgi:hypothetical protein